jgi:hypothetical protein
MRNGTFMKQLRFLTIVVGLLTTAGSVHASLVNLGDGTVRDTDANLIWLGNWNVNGQADWTTQNTWAESLDFAGSTEWSMPTYEQWDHLYAQAGGTWRGLTNHFSNVQYGNYWTGSYVGSDRAWGRATWSTNQFMYPTYMTFHAVAVRPRETVGQVPEPTSLALCLTALVAVFSVQRRNLR